MYTKLTLITVLTLTALSAAAEMHTDAYRRLLPQMPHFEVCLKHIESGRCLQDRPKFFTCDDPDINKYRACISDPALNKKIQAGYQRLHIAAKKEIQKIKASSAKNKEPILARMEESLKEYEKYSSDDVLKEIDDSLKRSKRFEIAEKLGSREFKAQVAQVCEKNPKACPTVAEYKEQGKKILAAFEKRYSKLNADLLKDTGVSLDETLRAEVELMRRCLTEKSDFCRDFTPDPEIAAAVNEEIKSGLCGFRSTKSNVSLICNDYYHALASSKLKDGKTETSRELGLESKANPNGPKEASGTGVSRNRAGLYSDLFNVHLKEQKYDCEKVDSAVNCDEDGNPVESQVTDLMKATEAADACGQEIRPADKTLMDATAYVLETQFRAYVDRLNTEANLSAAEFQQMLESFINSCAPPQKKDKCDYGHALKEKTHEYLKGLASEASNLRQKSADMPAQFANDTKKAALDLKEIEGTLKELLKNFPAPKRSLQEVWPELLPCHSLTGVVDDLKTFFWDNKTYSSYCAPLDVSAKKKIYQHEEDKFQEERLNEFRKTPELVQKLARDNLITGVVSPTGRIIVGPGILSGLESKDLECQKKAELVKKLVTMKNSLLANYPTLNPKYNREKALSELKDSASQICADPLATGEEVLRNEKLYTLYASCALNNVQNGERRDPADKDEYQFWRPINSSAKVKETCERRSADSRERCRLLNDLDSGAKELAMRGGSSLANPVLSSLDATGCVAMFTGIGGAAYVGAKQGVIQGARTIGVLSKVAAKGTYLTKTGLMMTVGGIAFSNNMENSARDEYLKVSGRYLSGLASFEEMEAAKAGYDQARRQNTAWFLLASGLVPGGKPEAPKVPAKQATKNLKASDMTPNRGQSTLPKKNDPKEAKLNYLNQKYEGAVKAEAVAAEKFSEYNAERIKAHDIEKRYEALLEELHAANLRGADGSELAGIRDRIVKSRKELNDQQFKLVGLRDAPENYQKAKEKTHKIILDIEAEEEKLRALKKNEAQGRVGEMLPPPMANADAEFNRLKQLEAEYEALLKKHDNAVEWGDPKTEVDELRKQIDARSAELKAQKQKVNDILGPDLQVQSTQKAASAPVEVEPKTATATAAAAKTDAPPPAVKPVEKGTVPTNKFETFPAELPGSIKPQVDQNLPVVEQIYLGADGKVQGTFRACCKDTYKGDWNSVKDAYILRAATADNPYFVGDQGKVDGQLIYADEVEGLTYDKGQAPLTIDFNKAYPGLTDYSLPVLSRGMNAIERQVALLKISEVFPNSENFNFSYLSEGGNNFVVKACPKDGGRCKVIKTPMIGKELAEKVEALRVTLKGEEDRLLKAKEDLVRHKGNGEEARELKRTLKYAESKVKQAAKELKEGEFRLVSRSKTYSVDLTLAHWAESLFSRDRGPKLNGQNFVYHAAIDKNPELLKNGLVVQDYFELNSPQDHKDLVKAMSKEVTGTDSADFQILKRAKDSDAFNANINFVLELGRNCAKATLTSVKSYCKSMMEANKVPPIGELEKRVKATLQTYQANHRRITESLHYLFRQNRMNPTIFLPGAKVQNGRYVGERKYSTTGFDPLSGKNFFFDSQTGEIAIIDL